jgi:hypothetical protein
MWVSCLGRTSLIYNCWHHCHSQLSSLSTYYSNRATKPTRRMVQPYSHSHKISLGRLPPFRHAKSPSTRAVLRTPDYNLLALCITVPRWFTQQFCSRRITRNRASRHPEPSERMSEMLCFVSQGRRVSSDAEDICLSYKSSWVSQC